MSTHNILGFHFRDEDRSQETGFVGACHSTTCTYKDKPTENPFFLPVLPTNGTVTPPHTVFWLLPSDLDILITTALSSVFASVTDPLSHCPQCCPNELLSTSWNHIASVIEAFDSYLISYFYLTYEFPLEVNLAYLPILFFFFFFE